MQMFICYYYFSIIFSRLFHCFPQSVDWDLAFRGDVGWERYKTRMEILCMDEITEYFRSGREGLKKTYALK